MYLISGKQVLLKWRAFIFERYVLQSTCETIFFTAAAITTSGGLYNYHYPPMDITKVAKIAFLSIRSNKSNMQHKVHDTFGKI
jgi:hypothetical protein